MGLTVTGGESLIAHLGVTTCGGSVHLLLVAGGSAEVEADSDSGSISKTAYPKHSCTASKSSSFSLLYLSYSFLADFCSRWNLHNTFKLSVLT